MVDKKKLKQVKRTEGFKKFSIENRLKNKNKK
jgi:hypothetical protein